MPNTFKAIGLVTLILMSFVAGILVAAALHKDYQGRSLQLHNEDIQLERTRRCPAPVTQRERMLHWREK